MFFDIFLYIIIKWIFKNYAYVSKYFDRTFKEINKIYISGFGSVITTDNKFQNIKSDAIIDMIIDNPIYIEPNLGGKSKISDRQKYIILYKNLFRIPF